jgi:hypothetical protein
MNDKKRWYMSHHGKSMFREDYRETPCSGDIEMHAPVPLSAVVVEEGSREWAVLKAAAGWHVSHLSAVPTWLACTVGYIASSTWRDGWYLLDSPKPEAKEEAGKETPHDRAVVAAMDWARREGQYTTCTGSRIRVLMDEVKRLRAIVEAPCENAAKPTADLLTPEEREAFNRWYNWIGDPDDCAMVKRIIDRIAPAPAPEWRPERGWVVTGIAIPSGEPVVGYYQGRDVGGEYRIGMYRNGNNLCEVLCSSVSPLEEKP